MSNEIPQTGQSGVPKPRPPKPYPMGVPRPPKQEAKRSVGEVSSKKRELGEYGLALFHGDEKALGPYVKEELAERPEGAEREIYETPSSEDIASIILKRARASKPVGVRDVVRWVFDTPSLHPKNFGELRLRLAELVEQGFLSNSEDDPNLYWIVNRSAKKEASPPLNTDLLPK